MEKPLNISLRNVATQEEAEALSKVLSDNDIISKITKDSGDLDYVFQGEAPTNKFEVHICEDDHQKAEAILTNLAKEDLNSVDKDYYLFTFTDDELKDILIKKNEWNEFDVLLSQKILEDRGVEINSKEIENQRELRDLELQKPEGGQTGWIIFGYITALIGGFIGILLGYSLWLSKKKLPNGTKVPAYNDDIRKHGKIIFYLGVVMFVVLFTLRLTEMIVIF